MDFSWQPERFWQVVTRLGEAQIVLPVVLALAIVLSFKAAARPVMLRWCVGLAGAALLTTVSKVAFIGWGLGWAAADFTGLSGHAMFAAASYPLLAAYAFGRPGRPEWRVGFAFGLALALLIGISRIVVGAHSNSEVLAGLLAGLAVAFAVAAGVGTESPGTRATPLLLACMLAWLGLGATHAPASRTHDMVTALSLRLSEHPAPYTRADLRPSRPAARGSAPG